MELKDRETWLGRLQSIRVSRRQLMKAATVAGATAAIPFLGGRPTRAGEVGESQVVMGYGVSLVQLDPHKNENMVHESVLRNMYECLVTFSQDLKSTEPQLATGWKQLNDLTVQFKLRQNVKFHNGEEFDAEAVKFSLNRMLDPQTRAPLLSMYNTIDRVDVLDKYTVNISTKKADPVILRRLSGICTIIVPPKYFSMAKPEELATRPVGTGPYKFVSWAKDADLVMEANPNYWGGAPPIKKVIVRSIPETGTRVAALLAGDVDIIPAVPPDDIDRINRSGKARVVTIPGNRVVFYFMDSGKKPTDNKLVRQAINYAANIDAIIKTILGGRGYRRATLLNPWHVGYDPEIKPFPYDPEKAKALLREAGYPNGVEVNLHQVQGRVPKDKEVGEGIAGELGKVGIKVNLKLMDWGTSFTQASAGKLDGLKFGSWGNIMQDADLSFYGQYHSSTIYSKFFRSYQNPKLDSLVEEARSILDVGKRTSLYSQVQKILMDDCPDLYCYAIEDVYGINNRVEWKPRTDEYVFYKDMVLVKR